MCEIVLGFLKLLYPMKIVAKVIPLKVMMRITLEAKSFVIVAQLSLTVRSRSMNQVVICSIRELNSKYWTSL